MSHYKRRTALLVVVIATLSIIINLYIVTHDQLGINVAMGGTRNKSNIGYRGYYTYGSSGLFNTTVYVIGGKALVQDLIDAGLNTSLIKPISLNQLPELPNNSVVVIDWSVVRNNVVINDPGDYAELNLTSPIINDLVNLIKGSDSDIIAIYANATDEGAVEYVLAYSWARAVNNTLSLELGKGLSMQDYLVAYPVIPVNIHEPILITMYWVGRKKLIIGPVYPSQFIAFIRSVLNGVAINNSADPADPCVMVTNNNAVLIWAAPMFVGVSVSGVPAYSDGNGTFFWDSCLTISDRILKASPVGPWYLTVDVFNYEDYFESSTMYNNGGFDGYQVGVIDYYYGYETYMRNTTNALIGDMGSIMPLTLSTSATSVHVSWSPSVSIMPQLAMTISNITWLFHVDKAGDNIAFPISFADESAAVYLPGFNESQQYLAEFMVDFENNAVTKDLPCLYAVTQTVWARITWEVYIIPRSSELVNVYGNVSLLTPATLPFHSYYVSGVSSLIVPIYCPLW